MRLNDAGPAAYFPVTDHDERMPSFAEPHVATAGKPGAEPAVLDFFEQLINGFPDQIALMDEQWNILAVNDAWTKTAASYDYGMLRPGANYLRFCEDKAAEGHSPASIVVAGIAEIDSGVRKSFRFVYEGRDQWEGHAFRFCLNRIEILGRTYATATRYDVTELLRLRRMQADFSRSLIEVQGNERRRMAREIHDSTVQLLVGLGLDLGQLKRTSQPGEAAAIMAEMEQLLDQAQRELRSISYLAHPPSLADMDFPSALKSLVEGFGRRSGLRTDLRVEIELGSPWRAAEVALYRVVQEALSNIHRHARATAAEVSLVRRKRMIHLVVADNGIGTPAEARRGVGLASMRSRLVELGGRLTMRAASPGTVLIASLPFRSSSSPGGEARFDVAPYIPAQAPAHPSCEVAQSMP